MDGKLKFFRNLTLLVRKMSQICVSVFGRFLFAGKLLASCTKTHKSNVKMLVTFYWIAAFLGFVACFLSSFANSLVFRIVLRGSYWR